MQRIFVYAHDAYGMGNTRRMTAIASHLAQSFPTVNILLASGSPVLQGFRLPDRVDYIKLPSVARTSREQYETRYLTTEIADTIRMRSALLRAAVMDFSPDVVLVDKKPFGIMRELKPALVGLRALRPDARTVLVLRDILDDPERTVPALLAAGFERDVNRWFDRVAVLGSRDIFDAGVEYRWSPQTLAKVSFCGYVRTPEGRQTRRATRQACGVAPEQPFVLINSGGGEDGAALLEQAVEGLALLRDRRPGVPVRALVVTGPHAPKDLVARLRARAHTIPGVALREFTDDMASYVAAADVVVSMGGYNSVCDILSLGRRAIVVPRTQPVREQWVRAERMAARGLFQVVSPDDLSAETMARTIGAELDRIAPRRPRRRINLDGLPQLAACLDRLTRPAHPVPALSVPMPRAGLAHAMVARAAR